MKMEELMTCERKHIWKQNNFLKFIELSDFKRGKKKSSLFLSWMPRQKALLGDLWTEERGVNSSLISMISNDLGNEFILKNK